MRTIWQSLAWKEWHEHKWKLVSITAVLWGVAALVLASEDSRENFQLAFALVTVCMIPLAVFLGLGAAANERSRGTLPFLQALPVPMRRAAIWKLVFGAVAFTVPIVLTVALIYVWTLLRGDSANARSAIEKASQQSVTSIWYFDAVLICVPIAASLFIWAAATGVNRKDEVRAGVVALAVMTAWYVLLMSLGSFIFWGKGGWGPNDAAFDSLFALGISTAPGGFVYGASVEPEHRKWPMVIVSAVLTHAALLTWYVRRFGRVANLEVRSPQASRRESAHPGWLSAPRKSPLTAVVWKQCRESAPLVLAGLTGVIGIVALNFVGDPFYYTSHLGHLAELYAGVSVWIGGCVAIIVGIGVCLGDVGPGLNSFWRSRPINADLWFWAKFVTGLLILLAMVYGPLLVILFTLHPRPRDIVTHPQSLLMPLAHVGLFAAAVATTCLVRHAVYAAILSISALYFGVLASLALRFLAGSFGWVPLSTQWWEPTTSQLAYGMMLSFFTWTLVAWLATRYDWGRKSRY